MNELFQILTTRFDEEELQTLCFELDIDYDDLPAIGKINKARELLEFLERRNQIVKLIKAGMKMRPDIAWTEAEKWTSQEEASVQGAAPERGQKQMKEILRDYGDTITIGDVGAGAAVAAGREASASVTTGILSDEISLLFGSLMSTLREGSPENQAEALQKAEALKMEVEKGKRANDTKVAKLIEGLVELVPGAVSALTSIFATPILAGIAGPVTKFVLDKIQGR